MEGLTFRDLTEADYPVFDWFERILQTMHQQARPDLFANCSPPVSKSEFLQLLADSCQLLFFAEAGAEVAGMCVVALREPSSNPLLVPQKSAYIDDLIVAEPFRRKGVGQAMMQEARRRAGAWGAANLSLKVWAFNEEAVAFYQAIGMNIRSYTMDVDLT